MAIGALLVSILSVATTPLQDATLITGYVENVKITQFNYSATTGTSWGVLFAYFPDYALPSDTNDPYYLIDFSDSWITEVYITGIEIFCYDRVSSDDTINILSNGEIYEGFDIITEPGTSNPSLIKVSEYLSEPLRFRPGDNVELSIEEGRQLYGVNLYAKINFEIPIDDYANISYEQGFNTGYNTGYNNGYDSGYVEGTESGKVGFSLEWLKNLFSLIDDFLSIEIFPNFRLWYCVGAPLLISLVLGFLKLFR